MTGSDRMAGSVIRHFLPADPNAVCKVGKGDRHGESDKGKA